MPGWTEERRRKQAENIRKHKPWEKSTGPRTMRGKKRTRLNALKDGFYGENGRIMRRMLRLNREFREQIDLLMACEDAQLEKFMRNELNKNHYISTSKEG